MNWIILGYKIKYSLYVYREQEINKTQLKQ